MLDNFISPVSLILLSISAQLVRAECFDNGFCDDRLALGARVGIGIGIAAVVLLLFLCAGIARRRRVQRRNLSYITNPNYGQHYPQQQQQQQPQYGGSPFQPQQPQPSYQPGYPPNQTGAGGPPGYTSYAAPTGPPPKK